MLKVCTAFHRKPGLGVDAYQDYWSRDHPAFVKRLPGLLGYAQNRPLKTCFETGPQPPFDGLVELWFADSAALKTMSASPEFAALCEDEHNFADRSGLKIVFTSETILRAGARSGGDVKRIALLDRPEGADPATFQDEMRDAAGQSADSGDAHRLVLSLPRLNGYANGRSPAWDACEMAWFPDLDAARAAPLPGVEARASKVLYCSEHVIVDPVG